MERRDIEACLLAIMEDLADVEHARWVRWQGYLHERCERRPDGSLVIPATLVERWDRQIAASYAELSEPEKESDREQVRLYLPLVIDALAAAGRTA